MVGFNRLPWAGRRWGLLGWLSISLNFTNCSAEVGFQHTAAAAFKADRVA
jgi:hypothetical protein